MRRFLLLFVLGAGFVAASCRGAATSEGAPPFQPTPPFVYVAKVKNVLVGLPPTSAEVDAVAADPAALGSLVDGWMQLPQYAPKMMRFFELAFQQTQIAPLDFVHQVQSPLGFNAVMTALLLQNTEESFARTMLALTAQGRPLTEAMTTRRYMMTTALKELYAFLDTQQVDDGGNIVDRFRKAYKDTPIVVEAAEGPIPIAESVDPTSPNFMHWYDPDVGTQALGTPGCRQDPVSVAPFARALHYLLLGSIDGRTLATGELCPLVFGTAHAGQFASTDFGDWTMVTIRPPAPGESPTTFFDLPALRTATELVLSTPRLGYFSTPAFFANWSTNDSNQMRVTLHQALIVATGSAIDGTDRTTAQSTPGLNAAHAGAAACFVCHKILDPTRSIFSATWSWNYGPQIDPTWASQPGLFVFRDVVRPMQTLADFGAILAAHPLVVPGWVQKFCTYANSAPCDETDPEFSRIVAEFSASGLSWTTLVKGVLTSRLTTHAVRGSTQANDEVVAVARRDHLCAALDARLGFEDVCGLDALSARASATTIPEIVSGLPSDAYGRGAVSPILPDDPSLFFVTGIESICESIASQVVDAQGTPGARVRHWSSGDPEAAIADFVADVMALPSTDPRASAATALLRKHFATASAQPGASATQALRSTFMVACQAPTAVSVGL